MLLSLQRLLTADINNLLFTSLEHIMDCRTFNLGTHLSSHCSPFTSVSPKHLFTHTANSNLEIMHFSVFHFSSYETKLTFLFELTKANAALYLRRNVF